MDEYSATSRLAEYVTGLRYEQVPEAVIERIKQCLADFIGLVCIAKEQAESSGPVREAVCRLAGLEGEGTVIAHQRGFPYQYAALLNGALAHTLDFDDTNVRGSLHPGAPVIPAALAMAERQGANGKDLLTAIAAGYEVCCRVGQALGLTAYNRGFHPTAIAGIFGATAAGSKILKFDTSQTENAFGLSLSQAAGSMQYIENGAWNKRLHPGLAAHNSILCLTMTECAVLGAAASIDGRYGLLTGYSNQPDAGSLTAGLGEEWVAAETAIKPYPSCRLTHGAVDGILDICRKEGVLPEKVLEVDISLAQKAFDIVGEPLSRKIEPRSVVDGQFSVYFQGAAAILERSVNWGSYEKLQDPMIKSLCRRIRVKVSPDLTGIAAEVVVKTDEGAYRRIIASPKGEPENPLTWVEVEEKFMKTAGYEFEIGKCRQIFTSIQSLEQLEDVREWIGGLRKK